MAGNGVDALLAALPGARPTRTVTVAGVDVEVGGITVLQCLRLVGRFPAVGETLFGGEEGIDSDTDLVALIGTVAPEAIPAVVAVGLGRTGDPDVEAAVETMPDEDVIAVLGAVVAATMPDGLEDFVERLVGAATKTGLAAAFGVTDAATPANGSKATKPSTSRKRPVARR